ncbi:hypothetical protein L484_011476 [Morus notabilis]|uniref:Uncharacterized protein n=1 Tax=Morus notabilis TaxID=981085 RepID=W9RDW3_9ROSA|nr:hypothetical protein L484_011476 [Morus notabilis]
MKNELWREVENKEKEETYRLRVEQEILKTMTNIRLLSLLITHWRECRGRRNYEWGEAKAKT